MGFIDRVKALMRAEGSNRGPFSGMGELGGMYAIPSIGDGWQRNLSLDHYGARHVPAVYACVMTVARAVSQCYPKHVRAVDGRFEDIRTSAAYRVMMNPNGYQTAPDFLLNLVATALFEGEAFVLASRNARQEVDAIHLLPRGTCSPLVDDVTREVFYSVGSSPMVATGIDFIAPARDVLHLRFHTPRHPLIGESPIKAAALAIGINVALSKSQAAFFNNMNRPSGILATDAALTREQMASLRAAFEDQAAGMAQGRIPILGGGLKFSPIAISSQDAELVQAQRMSIDDIARCFGVPSALINDLSHATLNNSETLISNFLAMSLGSYLEHIERSFDRLFGLTGNDYVELDVAALLRTDFAGRIDGLTKAVQGGLFTPNEARSREGVGPIEGGDTAYLQRQMTPIDKIGDLLDAETAAKAAPPEPPKQPAAPEPVDTPQPEKDFDTEVVKAMYAHRRSIKKAAA
jgi:HK97 family phage portal protein